MFKLQPHSKRDAQNVVHGRKINFSLNLSWPLSDSRACGNTVSSLIGSFPIYKMVLSLALFFCTLKACFNIKWNDRAPGILLDKEDAHTQWNITKTWSFAFATTRMNLEGVMLSEMSDRERQRLYVITYIWNLKKWNKWIWQSRKELTGMRTN